MVKLTKCDPDGPDVTTKAFSVRLLDKTPTLIYSALADVEVTRREGTTPLVVTRDGVVCLRLADFLIAGAEQDPQRVRGGADACRG